MKAYQDSGGIWTIGYGHTNPTIKAGMVITQDQANVLLNQDIKKASDGVLRLTNHVSQGQLDALTDFVFNLGESALAKSTLLKRHNQGRYDLAANELLKWDHDNGRVLPGLLRRRQAEKELYSA